MAWDDSEVNGIGMFRWDHEVDMAGVTDGTSNTVMLGEQLIGDGSDQKQSTSDVVLGVGLGGCPYIFPSQSQIDTYGQSGAAAWANQRSGHCAFRVWSSPYLWCNTVATPNWMYPEVQDSGCGIRVGHGVRPPRSEHPGGVNLAMGDGTVHFVSGDIDFATFQALGGRNDGVPAHLK
jgi:hypothetical protein